MGSIHPAVSEICVPQSLDPICTKFDKFMGHGRAHMGQMGKWPWRCTTTGLDNSTELRMEKIHQAVTEIWVPQVWQPPARPPAQTVTTIPLQPGGLRGKKSKFHVRLKIASPAAHFKASCIHGAWISTKSLTLVELKQEYCGLLVAKYYGCWCSGSLHQQVVGNHMYDHGPFSTSIKDFFKHALRYQFENCCIHSAGGIKCRAVR